MKKPIFKILDDKGRVLVPQELRTSLGLSKGDVVALRADNGRLIVKKAVVIDGNHMTPLVKRAYVEAALREFSGEDLAELLALIARLIRKEVMPPF